MQKTTNTSLNIALLGIFSAVVAVLQSLSYLIKIGPFNLSLVLIPIVLGTVIYGPKFGAVLGGVFGVITIIGCITGIDAGGQILFNSSPFLTILTCLAKGVAAGFVAGLVGNYSKLKNRYIATVLAAVSAPVVNTGLFIIAMFLFFKETLYAWSGDTNVFYYTITALIGFNFLIEFSINAVFSPVIYRIITALKKGNY